MSIECPPQGFVFWPVGCGDSTTVFVREDVALQVDIHELEAADDDEDPRDSVIDQLVDALPDRDGRPYLAGFAATHLDQDHIRGFAELQERVDIGDLWFTPRIFRDRDGDQLCDDAKAFVAEAERRIDAVISGAAAGSGDRVLIIGSDDLLSEPPYSDLPAHMFVQPGQFITAIDGTSYANEFRAFVHSPAKDDGTAERNDTSLGLQVTLASDTATGSVLLLGDLTYPTLIDIFDRSEAADVIFDAFLAPHHCSKCAMYWDNEDGEEVLRTDQMDAIEHSANDGAYIISSSSTIPDVNEPGDNPPHVVAYNRYVERVDDGHLLVTAEYPTIDAPEPIVFSLEETGLNLQDARDGDGSAANLNAATEAARGGEQPAAGAVRFGRCRG